MKSNLTILLIFLSVNIFGQNDSTYKIKPTWVEPEKVFETKKDYEIPQVEVNTLDTDIKFLENLPKSYDNLSTNDLKKVATQIENELQRLVKEKSELLKVKGNTKLVEQKDKNIKALEKEKSIVDLTIKSDNLITKTIDLEAQKAELRKTLKLIFIVTLILVLIIIALLQRKTIKVQDLEIDNQLKDIIKKNSYLDYSARIIRHDMHSGINTYIPRGINSLEKRIPLEQQEELKIVSAVKMIKDGLIHTQRVYKNVYEFTNLVKQNVVLDKTNLDLKEILEKYFSNTSYGSQISIEELGTKEVNEILFCSAIDSLVKNGLKYNSNIDKKVNIYIEDNHLVVQDNGVGMSNEELQHHLNSTKKNDKEEDGLGLKICVAILGEHGFSIYSEKIENGTKLIIKM